MLFLQKTKNLIQHCLETLECQRIFFTPSSSIPSWLLQLHSTKAVVFFMPLIIFLLHHSNGFSQHPQSPSHPTKPQQDKITKNVWPFEGKCLGFMHMKYRTCLCHLLSLFTIRRSSRFQYWESNHGAGGFKLKWTTQNISQFMKYSSSKYQKTTIFSCPEWHERTAVMLYCCCRPFF